MDFQQLLGKASQAKIDLNLPKDYVERSTRVNHYLSLFTDTFPLRLVTLSSAQFVWPKKWLVLSDAKQRESYKINQQTGFNLKDGAGEKIKDGGTYLAFKAGDVATALEEAKKNGNVFATPSITIHCLNATYKLQDLVPASTIFTLVKPQVVLDLTDSRNFKVETPEIICEDIKVEK